MRFFQLFAFFLVSVISAVDLTPEDGEDGSYLNTREQEPFKIMIGYNIVGKPDQGVIELYNGQEITVNYTFVNQEEVEVSLVGVGGKFTDPTTGEIVANITDAKIGPITLQPGEAKIFQQKIGINLPVNNYIMSPGLYVLKDKLLTLIGAKNQLTIVSDEPVSFFNPQLLFLELVLTLTFGGLGYLLYITYGVSYFNTASKASAVNIKREPSKAASTGKKTVDESWLPENLKKVNKRKAK